MITLGKNFISTPVLDTFVVALRTIDTSVLKITLTSGLRSVEDQLRIISYYAKIHNINFNEFDAKNVYDTEIIDGKTCYKWQRTWSKLLNIGIIINPPISAICLFSYMRNGKDMLGSIINETIHKYGKSIDSICDQGIDALKTFYENNRSILKIRNITVERKQSCIHLDLV